MTISILPYYAVKDAQKEVKGVREDGSCHSTGAKGELAVHGYEDQFINEILETGIRA